MSKSNSEVIEHVHIKLNNSKKKTISFVGIYGAPSHGVRARFPSEVEKITNTFSSREMNVLCRDINIDLMKLDNTGNTYVDMMFSSSLEQHVSFLTRIAGNSVRLIDHIWSYCSSIVQSGVFHTGISNDHITFAFIPSCIERKLIHEKFRDHSESCLKALENSLTCKISLSEIFKVRWDECMNLMKFFLFLGQSYTNCIAHVAQSEPRYCLTIGYPNCVLLRI